MRHKVDKTVRLLFVALLVFGIAFSGHAYGSEKSIVRLAIVNSFGTIVSRQYYDETIENIEKAVQPSRLVVTRYTQDDFLKAAQKGEFEISIASSGLTSVILADGDGTPLLAMSSAQAPDPNYGSGSAIVVRADRDDINNLEDLRGKRLAVMSKKAFAGYIIPMEQIEKTGINTNTLFSSTLVTGESMNAVLWAVKSGAADVGFIHTCLLENLEDPNMQEKDFKVIGERNEPNFYCQTSTELYPSWLISVSPKLPTTKAREIIRTLVNMRPSKQLGLEWTITTNYRKMNMLLEPMKQIYREENSLVWFTKAYKWYLIGFAFLLALIILNSIYVGLIVRRRTAELKRVLDAKLEAEIENQKNLSRIESLERTKAIGLISSTVAHELKQPLAVINNYIEGLKRRTQKSGQVDQELLMNVLREVESESKRAADIVEMVRNYCKTQAGTKQRGTINLTELIRSVVELMVKNGKIPRYYQLDLASSVFVRADRLDIELVLINLIRNADQAVKDVEAPMLTISLKKSEHDAIVTITDNGPKLSDEAFEKMQSVGYSSKIDGLGLGLGIVRQLLEAEAGSLRLERNDTQGLSCIVKLPLANLNVETK